MIVSMKKGEEGIQAIVEKSRLSLRSMPLWRMLRMGQEKACLPYQQESEGYYVLFDFESEAEFPAELDRIYKITEGVMRSMIIKKEVE